MNRREALRLGSNILADNKISDASIEAELLLRYTLDIDRTRLISDDGVDLSPLQEAEFFKNIFTRVKGMPAAYIIEVREFYGLEFYVDENVLIPRPETELLVDKAIETARNYHSPVIADIGTGCGNIAVSLAINLPHASICATDISKNALEVARGNCMKHDVKKRIQLLCGDLLEPIKEPADIIVANLPYVRSVDLPAVNTYGFEPRLALDGGEDGLDVIRQLCDQVEGKLKPDGTLLLEIGLGQKDTVELYLHNSFSRSTIETFKDLAGIDRVVCLTRR
jgi:release factor glutamine methyltransferase